MNKKDYFYQSFLTLKTEAEAKRYLRDLLTSAEIDEAADRLWIAKMLSQNSKYDQIAEQTKASSRTITRVSKWLRNGRNGYKLVIARLHHHQSSAHL